MRVKQVLTLLLLCTVVTALAVTGAVLNDYLKDTLKSVLGIPAKIAKEV